MKISNFLNVFTFVFLLLNLVYFIFIKTRPEMLSRTGSIFLNGSNKERIEVSPAETDKYDKYEKAQDVSSQLYTNKNVKANYSDSILLILNKNVRPVSITAAGYKSYVYAHSDVAGDLSAKFIKHGVRKNVAEKSASKIAKIIGSKIVKRASVFIAASGAISVVIENFPHEFNLLEKISIAISIGLLILLLYIWIVKKKRIFND